MKFWRSAILSSFGGEVLLCQVLEMCYFIKFWGRSAIVSSFGEVLFYQVLGEKCYCIKFWRSAVVSSFGGEVLLYQFWGEKCYCIKFFVPLLISHKLCQMLMFRTLTLYGRNLIFSLKTQFVPHSKYSPSWFKQNRPFTYNVTLRRVRVSIVAVEQ
jgi:hypothetical protein